MFRSIWYLTVGEILVRAHTAHRPAAAERAPQRPGGSFGAVDANRLPHLAALGGRWPALAAQGSYPQALGALVEELLAPDASTT